MNATHNKPNRRIEYYEGLVRKTAASCVEKSEEDFDDICNFLRQKVWKALDAFTSARVRTTSKFSPDEQLERFVFSCVLNGKKDVLKKKKLNLTYIEDFAQNDNWADTAGRGADRGNDWFEVRYMSVEEAYFVEEEEPTVPSILDSAERQTALMLYHGFSVDEIAAKLHLERREVRAIVESIRAKMQDWAPSPMAAALVAA